MSKRLVLLLLVLVVSGIVAVVVESKYAVFTSYFSETTTIDSGTVATSTPSIFDRKPIVKGFAEPKELSAKETPGAKEYVRIGGGGFNNAYLYVIPEEAGEIQFELEAYSGAHVGTLYGKAKRSTSTDKKQYRYTATVEEKACTATFTFVDVQTVDVVEENCEGTGGIGVYLEGVYKLGAEEEKPTIDRLFKDPRDLEAFKALVGDDKHYFDESAQLFTEESAPEQNGTGYVINIRGLSGLKESYIIIGQNQQIWAATLSDDTKVGHGSVDVWYYTNVSAYKGTLPIPIKNWLSEYFTGEIVYKSK